MQELRRGTEIPSQRFGRYVLGSRLGAGRIAEVFAAEAVGENGEPIAVALKLMKKGMSEEAFLDEADLMGLLVDPYLVQRVETGKALGRPLIAMELLTGGDLRELMEAHRSTRKAFSPGIGVHIVIELLKGLAHVHRATSGAGAALNLVHADVNPSNVFFSSTGDVKLGDFGAAASGAANTSPPESIGAERLRYLSPEQLRNEKLAPASDLFSAAIILHELTLGHHPFFNEGVGNDTMITSIRNARFVPPDGVDKALATILQRALSPNLKLRYRTAGEFAAPLVHYALDSGLTHTYRSVREWLEQLNSWAWWAVERVPPEQDPSKDIPTPPGVKPQGV